MRVLKHAVLVTLVSVVAASVLSPAARAAQNELDIQTELSMPGVKLVVVEFYATWCKPCMEAVPKWKELHSKYKKNGLRFIVVSADDEVCSKPPDWTPDLSLCDTNGVLRRKFDASDLPTSILYSWEGNVAMRSHRIEPVAETIENYFRDVQYRMEVPPVEVAGSYSKDSDLSWVRTEVIGRISSKSKFTVVSPIKVIPARKGAETCPSGFPPNSLLRIKLSVDEMGVRFFSLQLEKDGCIKASAQESYPGSGTQDDTTRLLESARKAADHLLVQMITPKQAETVDKGVTVKTYTNRFDDDGRTIKNPIVDQKGYLYVASDPPGANVVVNGEVKGQTPYQAELMVGEYVIKCESGALWIPAQKRVKMTRDGAEIRMVLGPNHGTLKVESYPDGAEISINGEPTGEKTPFTFPPKKAGEYTVTLLKKMHILKTVQVRLGEGKTTAVLERLEPNYGLLKVVSDPAGASITVDGENTGKTTPATIGPYSEGLHDVALSLPGYNDYRKKVKVERIKTEVLEVALAGKKGLIKVEAWKDVSGSRQAVRAEVRVDGKKAFTTPGKVELLLGRYEVEIDGGRDGKYSETVAITEGAEKKVVAELKGAGLGPVPGQAPPVGAERPLPRADQSTRAMKIYGLIGTFGGLALVGLGGVFTWQASAWSDSFKNASTNDRMNDARDKMNAYNGLAVAGYVVGSALAVSGIVVWAVGASKPDSRPQVSVSPGFFKDGVTVTVGGGW